MANNNQITRPNTPKLWRSCRLAIAFCVFLSSAQMSMLRDNLGLALVCMSKPTGNLSCDINDAVVPTFPGLTNKKNCEFEWDSSTRGRILGSFLYGYILTSMISGFVVKTYDVKIPFMCSGIGNAFFHSLCPAAVLVHTELFFACRFLQGMFAGLMVSPIFQLFSKWMPDNEVSTLLSFGFSGFTFGSIMIYPLSGYLCTTNVNGFGGWPLIFYVPSILTMSFVVFWCRYLYDEPSIHPNISQKERIYLLVNVDVLDEPATIPWKSICTSLPLIAYTLSYSSFLWNIFTVMNHMPLFMQTMLNITSKENGYLYCLPLTLTFLIRIFNGKTYPLVKQYLGLSDTVCRKIYCVFGSLMIITSFSTIIFVPNVTKWHAIVALTMNISLGDFAYSGGFYPTLLNLAPNYAGLLSGISTFIAFVVACPATVVNSVILKQNTKEEWNVVLWIVVGLFLFTTLFYLVFGSASLQTWSVSTELYDGGTSRSTLVATQSYGVSRNLSMVHPTHVF